MVLKKSVFKAYDIRGVYPTDLDEETAYLLGRAFVQFLKCKTVVVGKDMRKSGDALFKELARGINEEGADVIDIGMCTTPMLYFCVANYDYGAGIMITASHNPGKYNGFKLTREKAVPLSGNTGIMDIYAIAAKEMKQNKKAAGRIIKKDFMEGYVSHAVGNVKVDKSLKVVVDCGNGMGYLELDNVLEELDINIIEMYKEPDGDFPNHEANPINHETLADLQKRVIKEKADLGVAFDGDCDRVGFIDENGEIIAGDIITGLISESILKEHPGSTILYDLRSSRAVKEVIEKNGGKAVRCRVGHAFIKREMKDNDAVFAGELSCHFYFKKHFYTESSVLAIISVLSLMSSSGKKISELVKPLKKYYPSGEINSQVEDKEGMIKSLSAKYKDGRVDFLDGISVDYKDWWFNVRPSNTEPALRLNLEANTKKLMEEKKKELIDFIRKK